MPREYYKAKEDGVPNLNGEELEIFHKVIRLLNESIDDNDRKDKPIDTEKIRLLSEDGCEFMDSILFFQAYTNGCDFFVTRDEAFVECIQPSCYALKIKTKAILLDNFFEELEKLKSNRS